MSLLSKFLFVTAFGNLLLNLPGTWIEIYNLESQAPANCPIILSFTESSYKYVNECYGAGENKVVEWGDYNADSESMWLEDRRVVAGARSIFGDEPYSVLINSLRIDGSLLTIQVGDTIVYFKRKD